MSKKDKLILIVAVSILIAVIELKFIILPKMESITYNKKRLEEAKGSINHNTNLEVNEDSKNIVSKAYKMYKEKKLLVPDNVEVYKIIDEIDEIASVNSLIVENVVFNDGQGEMEYFEEEVLTTDNLEEQESSDTQEIKTFEKLNVNVEVKGTEDNIKAFINSIENTTRLKNISKIDIDSKDAEVKSIISIDYFYENSESNLLKVEE